MPGIAGIIGTISHEESSAAIDPMVKFTTHEPVYISRTYVNEQPCLCIRWVNRAGSLAVCMLVWNETNDVCLIFSGQDFAHHSGVERGKFDDATIPFRQGQIHNGGVFAWRLLSEFRDNYVDKSPLLSCVITYARHLLLRR